MRDWVRERMAGEDAVVLTGDPRRLEEDWECFHREVCSRCRKNTGRLIFKDECPTALSGEEPIRDPSQAEIAAHHAQDERWP